jgi:hypothetical protein
MSNLYFVIFYIQYDNIIRLYPNFICGIKMRSHKVYPPKKSIKILPVKKQLSEKTLDPHISSEKLFILPEISNPLNRVASVLSHSNTQSMPIIRENKYAKLRNSSCREKMITDINNVIKSCEQQKSNKNSLLISEINRTEKEMTKVVKVLNGFHKKKRNKKKNKKKRRRVLLN